MTASDRFDNVIRAIDAANAGDRRSTTVEGATRPYEVVYAERMTQRLVAMYPDASENLRIAARAQHIRRWDIPRASFLKAVTDTTIGAKPAASIMAR